MVEIQTISINDLSTDKNTGDFINEIVLTPKKQEKAKSLAAESEFHRIMLHLHGKEGKNKSGYTIIPGYFTLEVGKNKQRYQKLIDKNGRISIKRLEYVCNENGNKILDDSNHYKMAEKDTKNYISTFCGAGHSRVQKNLFVQEEMTTKLNDILLCGMEPDMVYDRPSKWNAYYAMVTTDSTRVDYMPNIVVIPDYKKYVYNQVDVVEVSGTGKNKTYTVIENQHEPVEILPFDGAGIVTPGCALKWARELNCTSKKGRFYLPPCFQFRIIPGIKGELMVFDLRRFAKEHKVSKIRDLGGKVWDIFNDDIDVVITQSQFKFWKQYCTDGKFDYWKWRNEFDKVCHGYKRTFNIVSYGSHPNDLRKRTLLSYQPLETVEFTDAEVEKISSYKLNLYKGVINNVDNFLRYRGLLAEREDIEEDYIPPYYKALQKNKELFNDDYIKKKVKADIEKLKNNILSGKQFVHGNYQVFIPDLYGLAEWVFREELGDEPKGLLKNPFDIYSNWWNRQCVKQVDIIRNPHIGMEHRIGALSYSHEMKKWFKYQSTGILSGMYDTLAMALGTADYDGDTVITTDNKQVLDAVQRELNSGHGRLIIKKNTDIKANLPGIRISDQAGLMKINAMSFGNSIGTVIDKVTDLWSMIKLDEKRIRSFIKIGVVVGGETIDFAKTGENAAFPSDVLLFLGGKRRGYWMRYIEKHQKAAKYEEKSIGKALFLEKGDSEVERLKRFERYNCNMNQLCEYAEKQIAVIEKEEQAKNTTPYDYKKMLRAEEPVISRAVYNRLKELQEEYGQIATAYRKEPIKSRERDREAANKFRWFYDKCRTELLSCCPDVNELLDMLIIIYYGAKHKGAAFYGVEKDILWNAFPDEMIERSTGNLTLQDIDFSKIEKRHKANQEYKRKQKQTKYDKKSIHIKSFKIYEKIKVILTKAERKEINILVDKMYKDKLISRKDNVFKYKRILAMLIYLSRKCEKISTELRALKNDGHFVKDTDGQNVKYLRTIYIQKWIKKYDNAPDELTDLALEKLTGVNHKMIETVIKHLEKVGVIQTRINPDGALYLKVLPWHYDGEVWMEETDYNKAGTMIRDYFRSRIP